MAKRIAELAFAVAVSAQGGVPEYSPPVGQCLEGPGVCCPTCGSSPQACQGHIQVITLAKPVISPVLIIGTSDVVTSVLNSVCCNCSSLRVREKDLLMIMRKQGSDRLTACRDVAKRVECPRGCPHSNRWLYMRKMTSGRQQSAFGGSKFRKDPTMEGKRLLCVDTMPATNEGAGEHPVDIDFVVAVLESVSQQDMVHMGLETHPKDMLIHAVTVLPSQYRPASEMETDGRRYDHAITGQLRRVFSANQRLRAELAKGDLQEFKSAQDVAYHTLRVAAHEYIEGSHMKGRSSKDTVRAQQVAPGRY